MFRQSHVSDRSGNVLVLTLFGMVAMIGLLAFVVDLGYLYMVRTELQRTADAAAVAAAWQLIDDDALAGMSNPALVASNVENTAEGYAGRNDIMNVSPYLDGGDVLVGFMSDPTDPAVVMDTSGVNPYNAVRVRVRKSDMVNGEVPLFFARALGLDTRAAEAEATAVLYNSFSGFRIPSSGQNLPILPFALDEQSWNDMLDGGGTDDWHWDPVLEQISAGSDGIREVNLYPQMCSSLPPGNRGTVDIGSNNNSTADIARQIVEGVNASDLAYHGDELALNSDGELFLNGDTGISAGVKDELQSVMGEPRILPVFREVAGPGNTSVYTIVKFVGVRIMEVSLTGKATDKRVVLQPAKVLITGGIPSPGELTTDFVYSPAWIAR